jgi:hypothetical protein
VFHCQVRVLFLLETGIEFFLFEKGPFLEKKKENTKRVEMLFLCSNKCAGNLLDFLASPIPEKARCEYEHDPIGKSTEFANRSKILSVSLFFCSGRSSRAVGTTCSPSVTPASLVVHRRRAVSCWTRRPAAAC